MGLYNKHPAGLDEVDVIVAGGGTAGCIVASRLASADRNLSVLVIEGGMNNYQDPAIVNIGLFFPHIMPGSKTTLFYPTKPSEHLAGRALAVPCGGVLGGGSSINMAMYSRAQRSDFDAWNMPGWSADEMLPYLKKRVPLTPEQLETYHGKGSTDVHGQDGPVHISRGTWNGGASEDNFMAATAKAGYPEVDDVQSLGAINAFGRANRYVSTEGRRQDTAHTYLHPRLHDGKHPNLHVVVESQVSRVIVEDGRAVGVVFRPNPAFHSTDAGEVAVRARKLVIVSCGAIGTPAVLERSGIGRPEVLTKAGLPVVAENLGVGVGYEDHQLMGSAYKTNLGPRDTLSDMVFGLLSPETIFAERPEILGYNGQDATGKLRPTDEEAAALGPEFAAAWSADFKSKPDKPVVCMTLVNTLLPNPALTESSIPGIPGEGVAPGQYLGLTAFILHPYSRGHVHITGAGLDDSLDFDNGFLSDKRGLDVKQHVWAYKKQREIMRRMDCFRGEVGPWHPAFAADSAAALTETDGPLPDDVENIVYSEEDDKAIAEFVRRRADTTWHSMGTCKMKPRELGGAVDAALNVYGVEGLKIADLSIAPDNVSGNTNNTALAIGERAADIFISELGLAA
ncbi:hypothetical protein LLEC1_06101 [Akanthomyces lecanii]|uniref:Glucose-methanol-choline oxidoreductase N-terminal domain-containing protein n=1 Tax=Cordyceps confragosa TaxID=2714763 RepID=A0A179IEZ7_CORDF|nr:hypothetical protein LLEC1_06101 [Akanthomyces lecanii]